MGGDHLQRILEVVLVPRTCDVPAPKLQGERRNGEVITGLEDPGMNSAPVLTSPVSLEQSSDLSEPQEQMKEGVFIRGFYPVSRRWRWSKDLS